MFQNYTIYKDSIQLEKNKITLIREVIKKEFDNKQAEIDYFANKNKKKKNIQFKLQKRINEYLPYYTGGRSSWSRWIDL